MQVRIVYFASCREAVGRATDTADLPDGATVGVALDWFRAERPALAPLLPAMRVAVNRELAGHDVVLEHGDELVLVPPVSGGSGQRARLTHASLLPDDAYRMLSTAGAGAVATFVGVVRPTSRAGRPVTGLFYEAYEAMAEEKLEQCLHEAAGRWPVLDAAIVHRLGDLAVGDIAVSIAVACAHRKQAFLACEYVIDRVKEIVPIWKRETGPDGAEWVDEHAG